MKCMRLQKVGVYSVDKFVDQFEEVIDRFDAVTDLLAKKKKGLDDVTGFWRIRGVRLKHSVLGIILQCFALANGDIDKVKIELRERKPLIKISLHGVTSSDLDSYLGAFDDYLDAIEDAIETKIPRILEETVELAEKAVYLKDNAASEFDALDGFSKGVAIAKTAKLVSEVPKIPAFIKQTIEDLQNSLKEIKELSMDLNNPGNLAISGKKCADHKKVGVVECYEFIYGQDYGKVK